MPAIGQRRPRIVFMDVQLPDIDGLTLTRRLKSDPATADILVVAVTSFAMTGDRERALAAGCDDYMSKPVDIRTLPARLADWLAAAPAGPLRAG